MIKKPGNTIVVVAGNNDIRFLEQVCLRIRNRDFHITHFKPGNKFKKCVLNGLVLPGSAG